MLYRGTQIALDLYMCQEEVLTDKQAVRAILTQAVEKFAMEASAVYYTDDAANGEYSYLVPCQRGHINIHVYPTAGFVAADVFTLSEGAKPEGMAKFIRDAFGADKAKITFLQRGDFGRESDLKPKRRSHYKTIRRAQRVGARAGAALKRLILKPRGI